MLLVGSEICRNNGLRGRAERIVEAVESDEDGGGSAVDGEVRVRQILRDEIIEYYSGNAEGGFRYCGGCANGGNGQEL